MRKYQNIIGYKVNIKKSTIFLDLNKELNSKFSNEKNTIHNTPLKRVLKYKT